MREFLTTSLLKGKLFFYYPIIDESLGEVNFFAQRLDFDMRLGETSDFQKIVALLSSG